MPADKGMFAGVKKWGTGVKKWGAGVKEWGKEKKDAAENAIGGAMAKRQAKKAVNKSSLRPGDRTWAYAE